MPNIQITKWPMLELFFKIILIKLYRIKVTIN
jgi:hypothetical protein